MSRHSVGVSQLRPDYGRAFLNVEKANGGHLEVWGSSYRLPTYLIIKGNEFHFIQFSDGEWKKEWFEENARYYDTVWEITENKVTQIVGSKEA